MKESFDFVVVDSTPSGLVAAIAAARQGLKVAVVTEDSHLGGMQTSGLGWTNIGQEATVGGLAREFFHRVQAYYAAKYGGDSEQVQACRGGLLFESHVAEKVYRDWLHEAGVECFFEEVASGVIKNGGRIEALATASGRQIAGSVFLDAGYEGDFLAQAGCSFYVGRESAQHYGESLAGVRFPENRLGAADHKLQAYDYRLCLTKAASNRIPFSRPPAYNAHFYEWHAARFAAAPPRFVQELLPLNILPNQKTDSRTGEMVGASWDWPYATREERERIAQIHRNYSSGYLWFLLTDRRIPREFQEELHQWGNAADEFSDNGNWPYHIYVREARRLIGETVMTQKDTTNERFKANGVALASFYLDVHAVELVPGPDAPAGLYAEGRLSPTGGLGLRPYEIPYRALLPRRSDCENLLVTSCLSASHVAFSSIRMEPVFMMLGHAAGMAAAICVQERLPLHEIKGEALRAALVEQGQIVDAAPFTEIWPPSFPPAPGTSG
jgi:hypothetical protein